MTYKSFAFCPSCCSFTTRFSSKGPLTVCCLGLWPGSSPHSSIPSRPGSSPIHTLPVFCPQPSLSSCLSSQASSSGAPVTNS